MYVTAHISKRELALVAQSPNMFEAYRIMHSAPLALMFFWLVTYLTHSHPSIHIHPTPAAFSLTEVQQH